VMMVPNRRTRIAQIGVGYWGPNLLRNLVGNRRCDVRVVVDLSRDRRDYVEQLYPGIRVTDDADLVFKSDEIDAVVIASPAATHFDLGVKALQAGKHILVEKPLARTLDEVDEIETWSKRNHLVVMTGHTFLFHGAVRYVKVLIDSKKLGDIRYIYSQRLNLGRIRSDVDALWNFGPHDISIIQYWLGDPIPLSITKHGIAFVQEGIDDVVFMNILYPGKIMVNIHMSWLDPNKVRRMTVVGTEKMVVYDDVAENKIAIYDKGIDRMAHLGENMDYDRTSFPMFSHRSGDVLLPKINIPEPLKVEIDHFIDCIQDRAECLTGIGHAKKVVKILCS